MNLLRFLVILTLALASISRVEAHAFLDYAEPPVGSTVSSPLQVKVCMTRDIEEASSTVQVFDGKGTEIDKKNVKVRGAIMTVSVPVLAAGTYKVEWIAVAMDTHKTTGTFMFTVQ